MLIFNPMTSASVSSMRMEISKTTHSIICKPILPIMQLYTMIITRKTPEKMAVMTTMKAALMTKMKLMNRKKSNKRRGVVWAAVLIMILKN